MLSATTALAPPKTAFGHGRCPQQFASGLHDELSSAHRPRSRHQPTTLYCRHRCVGDTCCLLGRGRRRRSGPRSAACCGLQRFPNNVQVPGEIRMPITLSTGAAAEFIQDGPATLGRTSCSTSTAIQIGGRDLTAVQSRSWRQRRTTTSGPRSTHQASIALARRLAAPTHGACVPGPGAPSEVAVPTPGEMLLPGFDTPTSRRSHRASRCLCTLSARSHARSTTVTLTDALAAGQSGGVLRRHAGVLLDRELRPGARSTHRWHRSELFA